MDDTPTHIAPAQQADTVPACPMKQSISMHENIPDWYDCCTCEAEPYWLEIGEEIEHDRQNSDAAGAPAPPA